MSETVLDIQALTRRFGAFTAVDAVTLSVNAGEVFALLGSNGAGKTTTIKMLTTLLKPTSGSLEIDGFDPQRQQDDRQAQCHLIGRDDAVQAGERGEHDGRDLQAADGGSRERSMSHLSSLP